VQKKPITILRNFQALLKLMVSREASDLFLTEGLPPSLKINGSIVQVSEEPLTAEQVRKLALSSMNEQQQDEFEKTLECNFAISPPDAGRFRVNVFQQKNNVGFVLRRIESEIPTFEDLGVPRILADLSMMKRGLVIVVGATGTGKSSTLASMVGYRNKNSHGHIITIEDPIEFT